MAFGINLIKKCSDTCENGTTNGAVLIAKCYFELKSDLTAEVHSSHTELMALYDNASQNCMQDLSKY